MKNPWNIKMKIDFDHTVKNKIIEWYQKVTSQKRYLRKKYVEKNPLDIKYKEYLQKKYNEGYGYKILARQLGLTYTQIRTLFINYLNIDVRRGRDITTDKVKEFRSKRVRGAKNPFYNWPELKGHLHSNCKRGIQGYYKRKDNSYIWLRSTWEYIYAKWLDSKNINWEYEHKSYRLLNKETYSPDFKIINENYFFLVEVKGILYQERLYKVEMFKQEYPDIKIIVVNDIKKYTKIGYEKELKQWKNTKLSEKQLKKLMQ